MKKAASDEEVIGLILGYLLDNSDAEDTIEGIVDWWLMRQRIQYETARVKEALNALLKKGFICQRQGRDMQTRYRINKKKINAIRAYLKQRES